jgi:uncharacterized membrane protein HdeD (DUF308 family)
MSITLDHVLAALVAVPCIIALAKATDNSVRVVVALGLLFAICAVVAPVFATQGLRIDVGQIGWVACGIVSIIAGVRVADGILTSLMITGGVLGALLELGIIARS